MATSTIGTSKETIAHPLDYKAQTYGLYRFKNETLLAFRNRVLDVFVNKSNASAKGLAHGASRQLGGITKQVGVLKPVYAGTSPLAKGPGIQITNNRIRFFEDFTSGIIEKTFDTYSKFPRKDMDVAFYLKDISDWVELDSSFWEWDEAPDEDALWLKASNLIPIQSYQVFIANVVVTNGINHLDKSLVKNTVVSNSDLVKEEVTSLNLINQKGDYYIDYDNGLLYTYDDGTREEAQINFAFYERLVYLDWAPVSVQDLTDDEFVSSLMEIEKASNNSDFKNVRYGKELGMLLIKAYQGDGTFWFAIDTNDTPIDIRDEYHVSDTLTENIGNYFLDRKENLRELIREI